MRRKNILNILSILCIVFILPMWVMAGKTDAEMGKAQLDALRWNYITFAVTVTLVKIVTIVIGYLVAKLGYNTMMSGVKGKNSIELSALGTKFKFKGVTPGLALGVIGVLMIGWALSTKHHFSASAEKVIETLHEVESNETSHKTIPPPPEIDE